ncbi:DUF4145 domain-containing protein, partial [Streptococcus pyogenes]
QAAARVGIPATSQDSLLDVLRALTDRGVLTPEVAQLFHGLRRAGNAAVHEHAATQREALHQLRMARTVAIWFHRTFGRDPGFKAGP